jgi:hypothetical protein
MRTNSGVNTVDEALLATMVLLVLELLSAELAVSVIVNVPAAAKT